MKNLNKLAKTKNNNTDKVIKIDENIYLKTKKGNPSVVKNTFIYDLVPYLKDSNAYGNNYFSKYFEWQGVCREAWFYNCVAKDFLMPLGVFITKAAHNEYKKETFPFQKVRCFVNVRDVKKASFYLDFRFCNRDDENIVFSEGYQQIVFADKAHKISKLPDHIIEKIKQYVL